MPNLEGSMSKILVVEDNELNLKLFHDLLLIKNHSIICSKNGGVIEDIIKRDRPDLILMDIQLQDAVSGLDIVHRLKNNPITMGIPIIIITAFAMKHDEAKIAQSGCDMYMSKPISIDSFFAAVAKFVS